MMEALPRYNNFSKRCLNFSLINIQFQDIFLLRSSKHGKSLYFVRPAFYYDYKIKLAQLTKTFVSIYYYMAGSASGQDESNPAL